MRIEARAKINWTLDVTGLRADGYHLLDMVMQPLSFCDELTLEAAQELRFSAEGEPAIPLDERHLCVRAAEALRRETGCGLGARVHLKKRVFAGAGLGGGSADAAAVLDGLNRLWGLGLSQAELERIGLTLGADVPFCLRGGLCRVTGIGEGLTPLGEGPRWPLVLVQPCGGLNTGEVFRAWHQRAEAPAVRQAETLAALTAGRLDALPAVPGNALQPVSEALAPAITEALAALRQAGAVCAQMSGSGSAVYGVFRSAEEAGQTAARLRAVWPRTVACTTENDARAIRP